MIALKDSLGTDFVERVRTIFSENGLLSKAQNFEFRPQQQEMAVAVARALEEDRHLVVEAGTGVGKSLAYLVCRLLLEKKKTKKTGLTHSRVGPRSSLPGRYPAPVVGTGTQPPPRDR